MQFRCSGVSLFPDEPSVYRGVRTLVGELVELCVQGDAYPLGIDINPTGRRIRKKQPKMKTVSKILCHIEQTVVYRFFFTKLKLIIRIFAACFILGKICQNQTIRKGPKPIPGATTGEANSEMNERHPFPYDVSQKEYNE